MDKKARHGQQDTPATLVGKFHQDSEIFPLQHWVSHTLCYKISIQVKH